MQKKDTGNKTNIIFGEVLKKTIYLLHFISATFITKQNNNRLFLFRHKKLQITEFAKTLFNHINTEPMLCNEAGDVIYLLKYYGN